MDSITFATLDPSHRRALDGYSAEEDVTYSRGSQSEPSRMVHVDPDASAAA